MKCPNCGNEMLVTVITNDSKGDNYTTLYKCEICDLELNENSSKEEAWIISNDKKS